MRKVAIITTVIAVIAFIVLVVLGVLGIWFSDSRYGALAVLAGFVTFCRWCRIGLRVDWSGSMRLAFYTCLALAVALFWGWVGFMVLYFIHVDHPAYGDAALVCFGGQMAFQLVAVGIGRYEAAR